MNYSNLLDLEDIRPIDYKEKFVINSDYIKTTSDFEEVRFGEPGGTVDFNQVQEDREKVISVFKSRGYGRGVPNCKNQNFRRHLALFRCSLDFWEQFSKDKVFSKEEIYYRCLSEGHAFTEFIKKSRATSLRALTSETNTDIEEEYFHPEYNGYNSIIHERYLIHWDDTKEIDDIKYAFMPTKDIDEKSFEKMFTTLMEDFHIDQIEGPGDIDMIELMKNTKMYDPLLGSKKDTHLMREFWSGDVDTSAPYYAKRVVVPVEPGSTRDTGIGDPSTILKVKILNGLCRRISEHIPYCANTDANSARERLKRVLKRNAFLHLDFKKFGLTFPRALMNIAIRIIGKYLGVDINDLLINNFNVNIDGETYSTERGTMLGWLDCVNCLCVTAILHNLKTRGVDFDFITFNDDVEISTRSVSDTKNKLELMRTLVTGVLGSFDIPISMSKTYGSLASVFLERYAYYETEYGLDMYKEQLTVKAYAHSCVSKFPWKAKMLFAAAEQWTKSDYAKDRCIDTCKVEFDEMEISSTLWAGGWYLRVQDGLDWSLMDLDQRQFALGSNMCKWKTPDYSQKVVKTHSFDKIKDKIEYNVYGNSNSAGLARQKFDMKETLDDINLETANAVDNANVISSYYCGRDVEFPSLVIRILQEIEGPRDWGP